MTAELNLDGQTEFEVRDTSAPSKPGRPQSSSRRTDEDRRKDRERYAQKKRRGRPPGTKQTTEVQSRMGRVLQRLEERQEGRGDYELAGIIREDGEMMTSTVADLVKLLPAAATPLLLVLGLVEPFLAFGRLFGLLRRRLLERRATEPAVEEETPAPTPAGVYPADTFV